MFRNNYDNDTTTYSPTGRLFQVEYALEAIKQGSAAVGLVSKTHAVLVALKRNAEELGSYQKKVIKIDDHIGIALAGLAPDARVLSNYLRKQALHSKLILNLPLPIERAVNSIADKAQSNTQSYGGRPYGVGLLVVGIDESGPHLFEFQPSGSVLEYFGAAIGARSQAARTYLEKSFELFADSSLEELINHALIALRDTLAQDRELNQKNTTIAFVGKGEEFTILDDAKVQVWLEKLGSVSNTRTRGDDNDSDSDDDDDTATETAAPATTTDAAIENTTESTTGNATDDADTSNRMDID